MSDIGASIADLEETDPLKLIIEIERRLRPQISSDNFLDWDVAYRYYSIVKHACKALGVEFTVPEPESRGRSEGETLVNLTKLEIELKQIDILAERVRVNETVVLDETWRSRIHSYLQTIRPIVEKADISIGLRDSILKKIDDLAAEVDRSRTRVRAAGDLLIELCSIAGAAAKELRPVVSLAEKIVGAFLRLQNQSTPVLALPSPDEFDLRPPEDTLGETKDA